MSKRPKDLGVTISGYAWQLNNGVVVATDRNDGECMILGKCPDFMLPQTEEQVEEFKKFVLNLFVSGWWKGARYGAEKKMIELRKSLGIEDGQDA